MNPGRSSRIASLAVATAITVGGCGGDGDSDPAPAERAGKPGMTLHASGRVDGEPGWRKTVRAEPGDVVEYRLRLFNSSGGQLRDVSVAVDLPRQVKLVFGSERIEDLTVPVATARPLDGPLTKQKGVDLTPFGRREVRQIFVKARVRDSAEGRAAARVRVTTHKGDQAARVGLRAV